MSAYHLAVPNTLVSVSVAEAFLHRIAASAGLSTEQIGHLAEAGALAVEYAVRFAYPEGRPDQIRLDAWVEAGSLNVTVHDNGLPILPSSAPSTPEQDAFEVRLIERLRQFEEYQWRLLGYGGKELMIRTPATSDVGGDSVKPVRSESAPTDAAEYIIRRLIPHDAPQVSSLVYRTYGHTYDDEDYYYPERIVAENQSGAMLSVVAAHPSGEVVGHYALEQREPTGIFEGSSAVVNPVHRGKGLMERMREFATEEGRRLGLKGVYFLPWTIHTLSQKANEHFAAHVCAANLSDTSPVSIKGFESESLAQRVSTLLYFTPLQPMSPRTVYCPSRHQAMVQTLYESLGCPAQFAPATNAETDQTSFTTSSLPHDQFAEIRVLEIGRDFEVAMRHSLRDQTLHHGTETVYLNLPLAQPACAHAAEVAEGLGFSFLGLGPEFAEDGDMLRMAFIADPLDASHIHVLSPLAQQLVDYALAEMERVGNL
jgi:hypothetical protein